ncbi:MAG TPA: outer membrane beta-barrel protein [Gemmatimonadales bacterium]|nr:outer membrane beta-barrel protein [Gemmatimonadales bacterium]
MTRHTTMLLILAILVAGPLQAQIPMPTTPPTVVDTVPQYLRPALGLHLGYAAIENAGNTMEIGATMELGAYRTPRLRFALGVNYLSTDTERADLDGSFSDLTVSADLRYKPFQVRTVAPYIGGGVGFHVRRNDYDDPNIRDIYEGVAVGGQLFAGVLVDANETGRWGFSGELRGVRAQNLDRTSFRAGVFMRL